MVEHYFAEHQIVVKAGSFPVIVCVQDQFILSFLLDSNRFPLVVLPLDYKNFLSRDGHGINVVFKHH